jgi:hypothetical protein
MSKTLKAAAQLGEIARVWSSLPCLRPATAFHKALQIEDALLAPLSALRGTDERRSHLAKMTDISETKIKITC